LYIEVLHDMGSSTSIVQVIKSRRRKCAGDETCRGWGDMVTEFWWGNL